MKQNIFTLLILIAALGLTLWNYMFPQIIETTKLQIEKVDSLAIMQQARLGYMLESEIPKELKYRTVRRESLVVRDSTVIQYRDSVITKVVYVPFYAAESTFYFQRNTVDWDFSANLNLQTKFFPTYERFKFDAVLSDVDITIRKQKTGHSRWMYFAAGLAGGLIINGLTM